ncbi:Calcineurin-like phosphoesterase superfamily domain-containing protein [Desulfocicer vacuolatum DSM 3385]|uniref:Calcineurin-like phosphoesterase superfamily domain-containing protein n=1 Tax=Desulfocicer vacuolatum DSM 3385 TaxID=1121400 RepID=A0A1W1ZUB5_9BACT|nr:metallophosphoesterase [Desulfocicer vacuolatum]SMC51691.1 Calcineurin-like phosphoesterase superfamily domain-containing protein [Desulfocicer vacuolatum DSM 3385]
MRIAVISDIHSNSQALYRVLEDIGQNGVDGTISLGDTIGYGDDPCGVLQLLKNNNILSTLGNHELALLNSRYRERFRGGARAAIEHHLSLIPRNDLDSMATWPFFLVESGGRFVHGLPPDSVMGYLSRTPEHQLAGIMALLPQTVSFVGHTHLLGGVVLEDRMVTRFSLGKKILFLDKACRYIINAGSVGQSRDWDGRAKYIIWDVLSGTVEPRYVTLV